jgi:F-type H+-transporting ATPase subunit a
MFASGFSWFHLIPAVDRDTILESMGLAEHMVEGHEVAHTYVHIHAWIAALLFLGFCVMGRMALQRAQARRGLEKYFTDERPTALSLVEVYAIGIRGLMSDLLGRKDVRTFFPLIAGLFGYIFLSNIQGIFPGFLPPTDNINANVGMALVVFLVFNWVGFSRDAVGYVKHLWGPVFVLGVLLFPIEVISLFIRPISLTIRLTANMFGDHQVFVILSDMIPVVLPSALLGLACLVSTIQAFVFSLLTVIYINLSLPHHEHDGAH